MDVRLNEDQLMFQDMTRRFLEDRAPIGALRKLADAGESLDPAAWREGAEQGWVALFVPEAEGGMAESAQGVIDAAVVAEELGRVVHSGPFLSSCVVADAIARAGSADQRSQWLPGLASGEILAAWCYAGSGVNAGIEPGGVRAERQGDQVVLSGTARHVIDAECADLLLVSALDGEGLSQFLLPAGTPGVTVTPLEPLDLGRRIADVAFDAVRVNVTAGLGAAGEAADQFERQVQGALSLICAETVGVVDRAFEITLEWVNQRHAFNRPIGSFQALKHRLADHAAQAEGAKAAAAHAARAVQEGAEDAAIAVSVAKSHCTRWAVEIIRDFVQMHGGIGVTWDHDIHFYLRRACSNEMMLGTPAAHHERLCRLAGL
ncbi:MAG TPA: acyl-CoA dehydrogenase family protein [Novosphingobium sp.]|nr:acyl-CoA dehydrogenase family protein [Novosphingobium sp.]